MNASPRHFSHPVCSIRSRSDNIHTPHQGRQLPQEQTSGFSVCAAYDRQEREELTMLLLGYEPGGNVAVWHSDEPLEVGELEQLAHMNLLVLAVTERLVETALDATAQTVCFARKNAIPVLPVHYISPDCRNETAQRFYRDINAEVAKSSVEPQQLEMDMVECFVHWKKLH